MAKMGGPAAALLEGGFEYAENQDLDRAIVKGVGAGVGTIGGAALGAAVGSVVPVLGTAVGGLIGGIIGTFAGGWAGSEAGELVHDKLLDPDFQARKNAEMQQEAQQFAEQQHVEGISHLEEQTEALDLGNNLANEMVGLLGEMNTALESLNENISSRFGGFNTPAADSISTGPQQGGK